jgi:anti-sigma factor RsiW
MIIDDILLMAYVDGELPLRERQEVEKAIDASADLAERAALLKASKLPYQVAYAHQKLPPVPEKLAQMVAEMARAHSLPADVAATTAVADGANHAKLRDDTHARLSVPVRSRVRVAAPWLAVAFIAGVLCCGVVLRVAPGLNPFAAPLAARDRASHWVVAAASHQQLYSRDTIALDWPDPEVSAQTLRDIRHQDGLELRVPDLRAAGLTFKRVQRLRFDNKPLVQIVYLPEKGAPVALCVTKDDKPDQPIAQQRIDKMDVVTWRQANLSYALIAASGGADLGTLGKQIAARSVDAAFGQAPSAIGSAANRGTSALTE